MNARKFSTVRVCLTMTALALCGALALTASCASDNSNNGGATGNGGSTSNGGTTGTSNGGSTTTSNGGSTGTASSSPTGDNVTFVNGQAQGAMVGWGWVALGSQDSLTSPTCDTALAPITNAAPCTTATNWSTANSLCITGNIPALPAVPVQSDYDNNWGLQIGVNAKEPSDAIGTAFASVTISVIGNPSTGLRAEIHRKGDPDATTYCASFVSGVPISATSFNTKCWGDATTVALTAADTSNVDKIGVQVSSGAAAIPVSALCLTGITFGR